MNPMSILVVDDDPVIRHLLNERLRKANYEVDVAEDGYAAEKLLEQKRYDVVLTDLMMPGEIGGIEVLDIAKNISNDIEVILITAHSSVDTAVQAMKKGAIDYLEKPINFDELFLRLEKIITIKALLGSAREIHEAMGISENVASETIQNLELLAAKLQNQLDSVENELRDENKEPENRIADALNIIAGI